MKTKRKRELVEDEGSPGASKKAKSSSEQLQKLLSLLDNESSIIAGENCIMN